MLYNTYYVEIINNQSALKYYKQAYEFTSRVLNQYDLKNLKASDAYDAKNNKLTFQLPDSMHLKIRYTTLANAYADRYTEGFYKASNQFSLSGLSGTNTTAGDSVNATIDKAIFLGASNIGSINIKKYWNQRIDMLKDFYAGNYVGNNVVDKIFKKSIVDKITFPVGYAIGEDMYFVYRAIQKSRNMYLDSSLSGYHYIIREESAMTSNFSNKFYDPVKLSQKMLDETEGSLREYAYLHLIHEKCKLLENMLKNGGTRENKKQYKKYRKDIQKINIINAFKILNTKQFLGLILMTSSPKLYMKVHDFMKIG